MQYLIQLSDESREYYELIDKRLDSILDNLDVIEIRLQDVAQRIYINRKDDQKQYNKRSWDVRIVMGSKWMNRETKLRLRSKRKEQNRVFNDPPLKKKKIKKYPKETDEDKQLKGDSEIFM